MALAKFPAIWSVPQERLGTFCSPTVLQNQYLVWPMAELAMTTDAEVLVEESDDFVDGPGNVVHLFQCPGQATC